MKKVQKTTPSMLTKNKDIVVVGSVLVVLAGAATAYYLIQKKKEKKQANDPNMAAIAPHTTAVGTPPFVPVHSGGVRPTKPTAATQGYPIQMGSRHTDVKILQRYLKFYKEDIGRTGPQGDGVDGIFGPKTLRAAQNRLKKTVFTQQDIAGMRSALQSLGK